MLFKPDIMVDGTDVLCLSEPSAARVIEVVTYVSTPSSESTLSWALMVRHDSTNIVEMSIFFIIIVLLKFVKLWFIPLPPDWLGEALNRLSYARVHYQSVMSP